MPAQETFYKEYSSWRGCCTASLPAITFKLHFTLVFNMCLLHKLSNKLSSNCTAKSSIMSLDVSTKCCWNPHFYFLLNQKLNSKVLEFQRLTSMFLVIKFIHETEFLCISRLSSWLYPSMFCNKLCFFLFPQRQEVLKVILATGSKWLSTFAPESTHLSSIPLNKETAALW